MKIDKRLNLVLKVERDDGKFLHVHSVPIPHAVFITYDIFLAQTWTGIMTGGIGSASGPKVAASMLKRIAISDGDWEGPSGVEAGLIGEIRRLTNVMVPSAAGGWETVPLDIAIARNEIDEEDLHDVMNAVVFFTLVSHVPAKKDRKGFLDGMGRLWGGLITPLNSTEYAASLPMLTPAENTGVTVTAQSIAT